MESAFLYLDKVIEQGDPVYVRNVNKERGILVLTLNDSGRTHREVIPNCRFPICLSNKATPDMIKNSSSLRQLLDAHALELVSLEDAERELQQPGVAEALGAAYEKVGYKNRDVQRLRGKADVEGSKSNPVVPVHQQFDSSVAGELPQSFHDASGDDIEDAEPESDEADVSVRVQHLVEALAAKDMKSRAVKNELMSIDLTESDLSFIIDNTSGIVQKFAKEKLSGAAANSVEAGGYVETV
ncbi:MAG: hypothetical protein DRI24_16330 [Deltaproteobacteria bacterium]|nr:MAG: hypothetical protein DRI24_16330 [Deltaproteobacteria bacterium]